MYHFFQHTPAVRQGCCVVWLDSELMWVAVADCCLMLKSSPIMVAVKRLHRCRLVVWHGHSANQINHQLLSSTPLLGSQYSMALLANRHRRHCWPYSSSSWKYSTFRSLGNSCGSGTPVLFHGSVQKRIHSCGGAGNNRAFRSSCL
jgi:hypothetical protein